MNPVATEAIMIVRELMKSDVESVRLQAAATILQYTELFDTSETEGDSGAADDLQSMAPQVIRARRFELVDANGKVLAALGEIAKHQFDSDFLGPGIGLALFDKDGRPQVRLCADNHDGVLTSGGLTIFDISNSYRVSVGASPGGGGISAESDSSSKCELFVGLSSPILRLIDGQAQERVLLAVTGQDGDPTLQLKDAHGSTIFAAP